MPDPVAPPARFPRVLQAAAAALLGVALLGGGAFAYVEREILPREGEVARGVRIAGVSFAPGASASAVAEAAARRALDRHVDLTWDGQKVLDATVSELGGHVNTPDLARAAAAVG